jgi:N-acetylmuramoyl-L-alanine amidase
VLKASIFKAKPPNKNMYRPLFTFLIIFIISCATKKKDNPSVTTLLEKKSPKQSRTKPLLILDAGHGGVDPGGVHDSLKLYEKNVTRKIVDALLSEIDTNKLSVVQTRLGDASVHRHDRIKMANPLEPDLLLTVHINSNRYDSTHHGFEVIYNDSLLKEIRPADSSFVNYANPFKKELQTYATIIQKKIRKAIPKMRDRGIIVRKDDIWMIYAVNYPSILFECGFITNLKDALILKDAKEIKKVAVALKESLYEILNIKA